MALTRVAAAGINTGGTFVLENVNTSGIVTAGTVQVGAATTIHSAGIDLGSGNITSHNINSTGIITATGGFVGAVTGNVTGNLTGNVTGDLTGDVTGNVTGNVSSSGANTLGSLSVTNDATVGGALTVTGDFTVNGTTTTIDTVVTAVDSLSVDGNVTAGGNLDITGVSTFKGTTEVKNSSFRVTNSGASGQYLQVTQNSNSSLNLDKVGDGAFYIRGNNIYLQNDGNSETYAGFEANGKSYLNYDGSTKLETTGAGVTITGDARVTGILTVGQNSTTINGALEYPSIRPTLDLNFAATKTLDRRITFTRDSIGTYVDELGVLKYAPNNTPRFDHNPDTLESLGLLIEESRTNAFLYSDLSTVDTTSNATTSRTTGLDGNSTSALDVTYTSASGAYILSYSSPISASTEYTFSVWIKKVSGSAGGTAVYSYVQNGTDGVLSGTIYNTDGQHIGQAPTGVWKRYSKTFTTSSGSTAIRVTMPGYDGNGLNVQYFGAQIEAGSFATSYIPTSGSTVTRADDNAVISGTNFTDLYNESEGTIFSEFNTKATSGDVSKWVVSINDETTNNYIAMRTYNQTAVALNVKTSGSTVGDISKNNGVVSGQYIRSAGSFAANDFDGVNDAELLSEVTSGALPTGLTRMEIGRGWSNGQQLEGHIRFLKYYNKKLPNAQLQGLTAQ
jgi:hypothetical protein